MKTPRYIHQITVEAEDYPGFWVDIVLDTKEEKYDMWLYHESIGVKSYMIGFLVHNTQYGKAITETLETVLEYVDYQVEESVPLYVEEYMPEYELYEEDEDEDEEDERRDMAISYEFYTRYKDNPIMHDEDMWSGKYKTYGEMWDGEGFTILHK